MDGAWCSWESCMEETTPSSFLLVPPPPALLLSAYGGYNHLGVVGRVGQGPKLEEWVVFLPGEGGSDCDLSCVAPSSAPHPRRKRPGTPACSLPTTHSHPSPLERAPQELDHSTSISGSFSGFSLD